MTSNLLMSAIRELPDIWESEAERHREKARHIKATTLERCARELRGILPTDLKRSAHRD